MTETTRVLAFTPSRGRPLALDHCIKQMQAQTHPVDHYIFLNTPEYADLENLKALAALLTDENPRPRPPVITVGESARQHANYMSALAPADLDDYDLFLAVDDDDLYGRRYVEHCVADFQADRWDLSGCHSHGFVDGGRFTPRVVWKGLGANSRDIELGVPDMMPPTYALSRRALDVIMDLSDDGLNWEDAQWRWAIKSRTDLEVTVRSQTDFVYHRHEGNLSASPPHRG
jgi:hypothetical protein